MERSKEYIRDGDVFQVVISQRFDHEITATPLEVYRVLRILNPSPYMYLLALESPAGEPYSVVGSSPEALVKVKDGRAFTHPIAGSRPRGDTPEHDGELGRGVARGLVVDRGGVEQVDEGEGVGHAERKRRGQRLLHPDEHQHQGQQRRGRGDDVGDLRRVALGHLARGEHAHHEGGLHEGAEVAERGGVLVKLGWLDLALAALAPRSAQYFTGFAAYPSDFAAKKLATPTGPSLVGWLWTAFGALIMGGLMTARHYLIWWPFHPLGFATSMGWVMDMIWFSVFLAWALKLSVMRFGGIKSYEQSKYFFMGLERSFQRQSFF